MKAFTLALVGLLLGGCASATLRDAQREDSTPGAFHRVAVVVEAPTAQYRRTAEAALVSKLQVSGIYAVDSERLAYLANYYKLTDRRALYERQRIDGVLVLTPIAYAAESPWADTRAVLYDAKTSRPVWSGLTSTTRWVEGDNNQTYHTTTLAEADIIVRRLHDEGAVAFSLDALRP